MWEWGGRPARPPAPLPPPTPLRPCLRPRGKVSVSRPLTCFVPTTQALTLAAVVEVVLRHSSDPGTLFLFGTYSIGKERVFMEVARALREPVFVSKAKLKLMSTFGWPLELMVP